MAAYAQLEMVWKKVLVKQLLAARVLVSYRGQTLRYRRLAARRRSDRCCTSIAGCGNPNRSIRGIGPRWVVRRGLLKFLS